MLLALLPMLLSLAPEIVKLLAGDKAGTAAAAVAGAVRTITGTEDPAAAAAALAADPAKAADLRVALAKIAADAEAAQRQADLDEMRAAMADVADARKATVTLAASGSKIAWGAPVVSVVVVVGFFAAFGAMMFAPSPADPGKAAMLNILVGSLASGWTAVIGFWIGSSAGSAAKNETIAAAQVALANSTPTSAATADELNARELAKD